MSRDEYKSAIDRIKAGDEFKEKLEEDLKYKSEKMNSIII